MVESVLRMILTSVGSRVVDPYSFFTDPDPDPDPIRIQGFNDQKLKKKKQLKKK
jgi:hypothetical protein